MTEHEKTIARYKAAFGRPSSLYRKGYGDALDGKPEDFGRDEMLYPPGAKLEYAHGYRAGLASQDR